MHLLTKLIERKGKLGSRASNPGNHGAAYRNLTASEYEAEFYRTNVAHTLIDVRSAGEFANGHLTGSLNIPVQELVDRMSEITTEKPVVLYCRTGNRSGKAALTLQSEGYANVYNIGGLSDLAAQGLPLDASSNG